MAGGGSRASAFRGVILLDTIVVSAVMLQRPKPAVVACLDQVDPRQVWLPSVVVSSCATEQPFTRMRPDGAHWSSTSTG